MALCAIFSQPKTDYYSVYTMCGRNFDMTALNNQQQGGSIFWFLPGTLTRFAAMIVVPVHTRLNEEREKHAHQNI
jgi:hypothetical protein